MIPPPGRGLTELADDAMAFALPRLKEAKAVYARLAQGAPLAERDFEVVGPFQAVAHLIGGQALADEVEETLRALLSLREHDGSNSPEVPVLRSIERLVGHRTGIVRLTAQDIANRVVAQLLCCRLVW